MSFTRAAVASAVLSSAILSIDVPVEAGAQVYPWPGQAEARSAFAESFPRHEQIDAGPGTLLVPPGTEVINRARGIHHGLWEM